MDWVCIISAYLLGSFPSAYLVGKIKNNIDIREQGSGNVGTMNTHLVLGTIPALLVLGLDMGKGAAAVYLSRWMGTDLMLAALLAVTGHIYPIWLKFRGGKGLATAAGSVTAAGMPLLVLPFAVVFLLTYAFLRQEDQASLLGMLAAAVYVLFTGVNYYFLLLVLVVSMRLISAVKRSSRRTET